jgi:transcriptional regulator with XRE-family HTH domain
MKPFSNQLRDAVKDSGLPQSEICQETGIHKSTMSRFVRGEGGLGMDAIDAVCKCIGVNLIVGARPAKQKRK